MAKEHPLYVPLMELLEFISAGPANIERVIEVLWCFCEQPSTDDGLREGCALDEELEGYLVAFTYYVLKQIVYFLEDLEQQVGRIALDSSIPVRRRTNFTKASVRILEEWAWAHSDRPYPTMEEKEALARAASLTLKQISDWFINYRKRRASPV